MLSILTEITLIFILCFRWVSELSVYRNLKCNINHACNRNQEYFVVWSLNIEKFWVAIPKVLIALTNALHLL